MRSKQAVVLVGLGVILLGVSITVQLVAPDVARLTLISGVAGGVLSLFWAALAFRGSRSKAGVVLTLIPVAYVLLSQTVTTFGTGEDTGSSNTVATGLMALMLFATVGAMGYILHSEQPAASA